MNKEWVKVSLRDILQHDVESQVKVEADTDYPMVGVYSYGKGLFFKESVSGINTSYSTFYRLKSNHIVMSQLFGWEGAIALSSEEFEGRYVSSQFPTFLVNESVANPKFIAFYLSQGLVWKQLYAKGRGMGSRRRTLTPDNLLSLTAMIPSLEIQKSIVSRLDKVKLNIRRIKNHIDDQSKDIRNLLYSKYLDIVRDADLRPMRSIAPIIRRDVTIEENSIYPEVGIRSFGKGTFHKPSLTGLEVGTKTLYRIKSGDLMFSNVFAWEGAIAVAKPEDGDRFGSHRFISCQVDDEKAIAEFLCYHFLTPKGLEDINHASPGGAGRNKTLGLEKLMRINVPIPALDLQREFVELFSKLESIREHHRQTEKELNELMTSLLDKAFKGEL